MAHPMGESKPGLLWLGFDRRLKLEFHGSQISIDGGLLPYRELGEVLGLSVLAGEALTEIRRGKNTRHPLTGLLRQSVYGRLAGYEDVNDAERLCRDPVMRAVVDRGGLDGSAASSSQIGRFGCTCYHPLFIFNQFGDLERSRLRPGHVHSAEGWREPLAAVVERHRGRARRCYFRADAAFASPEVYAYLEAEGFFYAIRLPSNQVLQGRISHLLTRPVGRPPQHMRRHYFSFDYQAQSRDRARRVVACYNRRGTTEQWIKEGKNAIKWTRLSCQKFRANEVRLQLHGLAYNLANFMRTLALPRAMAHWSLTTLREKLLKIGARMVRLGRYITFQLAEVAVSRRMFGQIPARIARLRAPPVPA